MQRALALTPLSREHHEALVLARRAARVDLRGDHAVAQGTYLLQRWRAQFEPHFVTEEQVLLPVLVASGHAAPAGEALARHAELRGLIARLAEGDMQALPAWGEAMQRHVRFEERELFPLAQRVLDLPGLADGLARPEFAGASSPQGLESETR